MNGLYKRLSTNYILQRSSIYDGIQMVCEARLIFGQPKNHVFSQPLGSDSRISLAPPAPS